MDLPADSANGGGTTLIFSDDIRLEKLIGLSIKNLLLTIVTLTLYRFWARTEVRRRVWAGTIINDQPLEYRGKGMELFAGFLIVTFALFLPLVLAFAAVQFFYGQFAVSMLAGPVYVGAVIIMGVAIYRARAYLMSRTAWRGVRLRQGPDWGWRFGLSMLGHVFMSLVTLGWWSPRMRMRMAFDLWSKTSWGGEPFVFNEGETNNLAGGLYKSYAVAWFGGGLIMIVAVALGAAIMIGIAGAGAFSNPEAMQDPAAAIMMIGVFYAVFIPAIILAAFASLPYQAATLRRIADKLRIDHLRFQLDVKSLPLFGLAVANLLTIILSLGVLSPLAQARSWRFMVRRLTTAGSIDLARIHQSQDKGPGRGEGLADAFDVSVLSGGL